MLGLSQAINILRPIFKMRSKKEIIDYVKGVSAMQLQLLLMSLQQRNPKYGMALMVVIGSVYQIKEILSSK